MDGNIHHESTVGTDECSVRRTVLEEENGTVVRYRLEAKGEGTAAVRLVDRLPPESTVVDDRDGLDPTVSEQGLLTLDAVVSDSSPATVTVSAPGLDDPGVNLSRDPAVERFDGTRSSETSDGAELEGVSAGGPIVESREFDGAGEGRISNGRSGGRSGPAPSIGEVNGTGTSVEEVGSPAEREGKSPAMGVVATGADPDALLRTVLRSIDQGYEVFVAHSGDADPETLAMCRRHGAEVIASGDEENVRYGLVVAAGVRGLPGVIVQTDPGSRIDFERSEERFAAADESSVTAVHESDVSRQEGGTVVGIPAFNEAGTIGDVVTEARRFADVVVVVDDGSDDATATRAEEAGATVIRNGRNKGYGASLRRLFDVAVEYDADNLVVLDGDGQHDASDIPVLVDRRRETDADVVIGSRFAERSETDLPLYRSVGLGVVNLLTNLSMGVLRPASYVRDTQSGFRVYSKQTLESLAADESIGEGMDASTDILYHAHQHGYRIEEVGTTISYDVENASSHDPVSHGYLLVKNILKTIERERPISSLGLPGFVSAFGGLGFGYWTFHVYLATGTFPLSLAITSAFFTLAGIFSCFTAIILHSLNTHL